MTAADMKELKAVVRKLAGACVTLRATSRELETEADKECVLMAEQKVNDAMRLIEAMQQRIAEKYYSLG